MNHSSTKTIFLSLFQVRVGHYRINICGWKSCARYGNKYNTINIIFFKSCNKLCNKSCAHDIKQRKTLLFVTIDLKSLLWQLQKNSFE